jgi:hypothetical protein
VRELPWSHTYAVAASTALATFSADRRGSADAWTTPGDHGEMTMLNDLHEVADQAAAIAERATRTATRGVLASAAGEVRAAMAADDQTEGMIVEMDEIRDRLVTVAAAETKLTDSQDPTSAMLGLLVGCCGIVRESAATMRAACARAMADRLMFEFAASAPLANMQSAAGDGVDAWVRARALGVANERVGLVSYGAGDDLPDIGLTVLEEVMQGMNSRLPVEVGLVRQGALQGRYVRLDFSVFCDTSERAERWAQRVAEEVFHGCPAAAFGEVVVAELAGSGQELVPNAALFDA